MPVEDKFIKNIRYIAASMIEIAKSGHPGASLSLAPVLHVLFGEVIRIHKDFQDSEYRDIVIVSNGHACPTQYICLALHGYLSMEDLKLFRKINSHTPGHPEVFTPGIEASTGPLGQGIGNAVGFAISMKKIKSPAKVFVIFGDGCYQEGISHEVFAIAANLNLDNVVFIYDSNQITIDGSTELSMNESAEKRFKAYGFEVFSCQGEDIHEIRNILAQEQKAPKAIILHTRIAEGCSKVGSYLTHGQPLGQAVVDEFKDNEEEFTFNDKMVAYYSHRMDQNLKYFQEAEAKHKTQKFNQALESVFEKSKNVYKNHKKNTDARPTRQYIADTLDDLRACGLPVLGGSADLASSTLTRSNLEEDFNRKNYGGTYIRYGIREHGMTSIQNSITFHGFYKSFSATFFEFLAYGYPGVRMAALGKIPNLYIATHDSIGLGEDGPAHQPIELYPLIRAAINIYLFRPCDSLEVRFALWFGLTRTETPVVVCCTRQPVDPVSETSIEGMEKGAYFLRKTEKPDLTLLATGSEVPLALRAADLLQKLNLSVSVVSMLSFELFDEQSDDYKQSLLDSPQIISIEAAATFGWSKYAHHSIGMETYGASANYKSMFDYFGFTPEKIVDKILTLMKHSEK
ncbi:Transketolase [Pseudoloma neurophilia]|uniref:Transketolase n=1 Tax=Pseudoloma neurophilia TaxID=146866 RepID=A0A0R0M177_9MICR|nr:Transketolase [Pseudoloma neurophilia]